MDEQTLEQLLMISNIDDLMELIALRDKLRALFVTLQSAAMATSNPLFVAYMEQVGKTGKRVNRRIQDWFDRQAWEYSDETPEEGGDRS